jgi:LysM repeat protein
MVSGAKDKNMKQKGSPSSIINKYKKRNQSGPVWITVLAVILVAAGLIFLAVWLFSGGGPKISWFATETPTPTSTNTPTQTFTPTLTSTITLTPSQTVTPTASGPFLYTIQEGDTLTGIVEKFNLGDNGLELLFMLNPTIDTANPIISVGQEITVPNPDLPLPTETPVPANLPRGTKVIYVVKSGDNLEIIASKFNSTMEAILALKENKDAGITDANTIYVGQKIIVVVNLVTPTPTAPPTITPTSTP